MFSSCVGVRLCVNKFEQVCKKNQQIYIRFSSVVVVFSIRWQILKICLELKQGCIIYFPAVSFRSCVDRWDLNQFSSHATGLHRLSPCCVDLVVWICCVFVCFFRVFVSLCVVWLVMIDSCVWCVVVCSVVLVSLFVVRLFVCSVDWTVYSMAWLL